MKRSTLRRSFALTQLSGLKVPSEPSPSGISQAIRAGRWLASKCPMRAAPDRPARRRDHVSSTPQASGDSIPSPVTTTRLMTISAPCHRETPRRAVSRPRVANPSARRLLGNELHGIAEGLDALGSVVRDFDPELFLEGHHELHRVETVGTEVVDEARRLADLVFLDVQMLNNNLLDAFGDIAHDFSSVQSAFSA